MYRPLLTALSAAIIAFAGSASAQQAPDVIEVDYLTVAEWRVVEVEWAGEEPYTDATSTFDGRCSVPSEYIRTGTFDSLTFPTGRGSGASEQCGRFVWETDDDGQRVIRGDLTSDGVGSMEGVDGSVLYISFDASSVYDPAMGMVVYTMDIQMDDMTGVPGLTFVAGRMEATYAIADVEALMTGAIEIVGVVQGAATFVPAAVD